MISNSTVPTSPDFNTSRSDFGEQLNESVPAAVIANTTNAQRSNSTSVSINLQEMKVKLSKLSIGKLLVAAGVAFLVVKLAIAYQGQVHDLVEEHDSSLREVGSWLGGLLIFFLPSILRMKATTSSTSALSSRFEFVLLNAVDDSDIEVLNKFLDKSKPKMNTPKSFSALFKQSLEEKNSSEASGLAPGNHSRVFVLSFDTDSPDTDKQRFQNFQEVCFVSILIYTLLCVISLSYCTLYRHSSL